MNASLFANSSSALGAPGAGETLPALLEDEIRRIYSRSPIYGRRFPLHPEALRWSCYREIPALSKREIVEAGHQSFFPDYREVERGLADRRFEYENTSGTTSAPRTASRADSSPWVSSGPIGVRETESMSPVSMPASRSISVMPVSVSPCTMVASVHTRTARPYSSRARR